MNLSSRPNPGWIGLLAILILSGSLWWVLSESAQTAVKERLERDVETGRWQTVRQADEALTDAVRARLAGTAGEEAEIDLENPTELDLRFLLGELDSASEPARRSAARALVQIGEPRAVLPLVRRTGGRQGDDWYCAAALEILRLQQAHDAAALMIEVLSAAGAEAGVCHEELLERVGLVLERQPDAVERMLDTLSERGQVFLLERLSFSPTAAARAALDRLANGPEGALRDAARRWIERSPGEGGDQESRSTPAEDLTDDRREERRK